MKDQRWGVLSAMLVAAGIGLLLLFIPLSRAASDPDLRLDRLAGLQLANTFVISGTVTDENTGQGIPDVEVFVWNRDQGSGVLENVTGSSGAYSVTLGQGNYDLNFNPPCGSGYTSKTVKGVWGPPDQTHNVTLEPGNTVSGTVFAPGGVAPLYNVALYAFNKGTGDGFGLPPTDANGHYCIGLVTGTYDLTFTPPPCLGYGPTTTIATITEPVIISPVLPLGFTVGGCVTGREGQPQAGVQIYAYDPVPDKGFGFAPTNQTGCYSGTLPAGTFDIQFIPPPELGLGSVTLTDVVSQTGGCPNTSLPVTLPPGVTLSGQTTCRGAPVKNVYIHATPLPGGAPGDDLNGWGVYSVDDGAYGLPLVTGTYRVTFEPPPLAGLSAQVFTVTEMVTDTVINVDFCPIYLPMVFR